MKKQHVIALIILLLVGVVIFAVVNKQDKKPVVIGATLALTGNLAYLGEGAQNGMLLAIDEINAYGGINGRPLRLAIENNAGDAKLAVSGVTKLLAVDNADVIVSVFTHITNAIKDLVRDHGKVLLYESTVGEIAKESSFFFRDYYDAAEHGRAAGKLVIELGVKNVGVLSEQSDQCALFSESMEETIRDGGIPVIHQELYLTTDSDFRTSLLKLKNVSPEAIVMCAWRHEHLVMRQFTDLGMTHIPTVHWGAPILPVADTQDMRAIYAANKALSTWYGFDVSTPEGKAFAEKYTLRFKTDPLPDAAYAYDDVHILAEALRSCADEEIVDQECLVRELHVMKYEGTSGTLTFDADGIINRHVLYIRAEEDGWKQFKPTFE